ncbi:uncharacterized protein V1516DRAFT_685304 [Lipomyces oligophaga]|uniref:uncharacterized protein n=1 Tax=Lipomyces oligophaga TaxID=45792 RepID=UPI0034CD723F
MAAAPKSFDELPSWDELPYKRRFWAWGPPGSHEEGLGMLNLLTPEHLVKNVVPEIRTGERVGLGWGFHKLENPPFGRVPFNLKIIPIAYVPNFSLGVAAFDDEYVINPQQSSQWDGFRHHSQPNENADGSKTLEIDDDCVWYGGTTREEIVKTDRIGIHHWAKEGIVARGVLLDYELWAKEQGIEYSSFSTHTISYEDLQSMIERFDVELKRGDILFVRIGLIEEWNGFSAEQKEAYGSGDEFLHAGLEQSEEIIRFLWDSHFCAVASDSVSWEVFPPTVQQYNHHIHLLAGWGCPIGEMFDLDGLAELCKKHERYSFFVSSMPFNAVGGVSSPPNAVAIF